VGERGSLLGAGDPSEVVFTSCGSESDNHAIFGTVQALGPETTVITSKVEHPAVLQPCRALEERGHRVVFAGVHHDGTLDMDAYRGALSIPGPKLVTLMWANNETGVLFPIRECAELAKAAGAVFHTDATQAVGKVAEIDASAVPFDMLSFSGHKIHAPKGIGALYIRRGTPVRPFLLGGHQERRRRAGTENVPYIEGEAMLFHLGDAGICASSGSACTSGSLEPSHVLRAMDAPFTALHGSLRFSLSRYTTDADVDAVLEAMPGIVKTLRELSPFGRGEEPDDPGAAR